MTMSDAGAVLPEADVMSDEMDSVSSRQETGGGGGNGIETNEAPSLKRDELAVETVLAVAASVQSKNDPTDSGYNTTRVRYSSRD